MMTPAPDELFETHRQTLLRLAYRMLGSWSEADDIVQDAYMRWQSIQIETVREPLAFLKTIVARLALDGLRARKRRQQTYVGPWLPEPIPTEPVADAATRPDEVLSLNDDLTIATLLLMEELKPEERAAFLLHDVYDISFKEISLLIGTSDAAARQHASRARKRLHTAKPIKPPPRAERERLVGEFMSCFATGNIEKLKTLLARDVSFISDGGARGRAALRPFHGRDAVLDLIKGLAWRDAMSGLSADVKPAQLNGLDGFAVRRSDGTFFTISLELSDAGIEAIYVMRNPDKLHRLAKIF